LLARSDSYSAISDALLSFIIRWHIGEMEIIYFNTVFSAKACGKAVTGILPDLGKTFYATRVTHLSKSSREYF
jgi:hypothetical protein